MNVAEKRIIETETTFSENNRSIGSLKAKLQNLYNDLETNEARLQVISFTINLIEFKGWTGVPFFRLKQQYLLAHNVILLPLLELDFFLG